MTFMQVLMMLWFAAFIASFAVTFCGIFFVIAKVAVPPKGAEEGHLSWGERAGRRAADWNDFLVSDTHRLSRRVVFGGFGCCLMLIAILALATIFLPTVPR